MTFAIKDWEKFPGKPSLVKQYLANCNPFAGDGQIWATFSLGLNECEESFVWVMKNCWGKNCSGTETPSKRYGSASHMMISMLKPYAKHRKINSNLIPMKNLHSHSSLLQSKIETLAFTRNEFVNEKTP